VDPMDVLKIFVRKRDPDMAIRWSYLLYFSPFCRNFLAADFLLPYSIGYLHTCPCVVFWHIGMHVSFHTPSFYSAILWKLLGKGRNWNMPLRSLEHSRTSWEVSICLHAEVSSIYVVIVVLLCRLGLYLRYGTSDRCWNLYLHK
jgi:hypothetical protein